MAQIKLNEPAPEILVDNWVDNDAYKFSRLEGKAIVLDFWFTQCAPCIYTVPHLNDLSRLYSNDDIAFVAITFENEYVVSKFLNKKEILAKIGIDTTFQLINAFEVKGYPTTFLIDSKGILRWKGYPSHLNTEIINLVLNKGYHPTVRPEISLNATKLYNELEGNKIYPITVTKNNYMDGASSGIQMNAKELSILNKSLDNILAYTLKTSVNRISISDSTNYDIRFKIPSNLKSQNIMDAVTASILYELDYQIKIKNKTVEGYALKIMNDSLFIANAIDTTKVYQGLGTTTNQTHWKGKGAQISDLVNELENRFDIYISDASQLNGFFEFIFSIESIEKAKLDLLQTYGLELIPKELQIGITIIEN